MLHSQQFCSNCDHFVEATNMCSLHPAHVQVSAEHFCGQWENHKLPKHFGSALKLTDKDLHTWLIEEAPPALSRAEMTLAGAIKFKVSRRTIDERLKKLALLGYVKFQKGEDGRTYVSAEMNAEETDFKKFETPKENETALGEPLLVRRKYDFEDIKIAWEKDQKERLTYSEIARRSTAMGRAAFNRIVKDALKDGLLRKTDAGLYTLT